MKFITPITYIAIVLAITSCKTHSNDLATILGAKQNYKPVTTDIYWSKIGFCGSALFLNTDSTFLNETGCEGHSYVTMGTWKYTNDSIELNATENTQLSLISNIELSGSNNALHTTFLIFDKTGNPVQNFIIIPMKKREKYNFTSNASIVSNAKDMSVDIYETNDNGFANVDISKYDTLVFSQLEILSNKKFRFSTESLPDTIKIYLNFNKEGVRYSELEYVVWRHSTKFKKYSDKLFNRDISLKRYQQQ